MVYALVFAVTLALSSVSNAATYYVATTGNDANPGSSGSPYRTIKRCLQSPIVPGDTCIVKSGTYTAADIGRTDIAVWISTSEGSVAGTAGAPITLKSETYRGAVIKIPSINAGTSAIRVSLSHYVIEGFDMNSIGVTQDSGLSNAAAAIVVNANNTTIRRNYLRDISRELCSNSAFSHQGISVEANIQNTLIEYNEFARIGRKLNGESGCVTDKWQHDHGIYSKGADFLTIQRNIFYQVDRGYAIQLFQSGSTHSNVKILNNTFDGGSPDVRTTSTVIMCNTLSTVDFSNNIVRNPGATYVISWCPSTTATNVTVRNNVQNGEDADATNDMMNPSSKPASGITASGNIFNATLGLTSTTVGSEDFTLLSTSAALNAGVDVGLTYNGTAPEIGAFEVPAFASCEITDATNIRATFVNNTNPPLLPASSATTFTARRNTVSNTVTGVARNGDNTYDITVTTSYGGGDNGDISWASGNITNSALLGGVWNQKFITVLTNQTCTNSVGGASYTLAQAAFRFKGVDGQEPSTDWRGAENVPTYKTVTGGALVVRVSITCSVADCGDQAFLLYRDTGSGYDAVPDTFDAQNVAFCVDSYHYTTTPQNGSATTNQLTTGGTFVAGGVVHSSNAIPNVTLVTGQKTELQYCVRFDTDASGTVDFRVYSQTGAALSTYTSTPHVEIIPAQSTGGL